MKALSPLFPLIVLSLSCMSGAETLAQAQTRKVYPSLQGYVVNASGANGSDARDGRDNYLDSNGSDASSSTPGQDAEDIHVELSLSPDGREVLMRGSHSANIPISGLRSILFQANGGSGGKGGRGGDGRRGSDGRDGSDVSDYNLYAGRGTDGQAGGDGGNGSAGSDGGDAGTVTIRIAPRDAHLAFLVQMENSAGLGGAAGRNGKGGAGGRGGRGGSGTYYSFRDGEYKHRFGGSNGMNGRSGSDGRASTHAGQRGASASAQIMVGGRIIGSQPRLFLSAEFVEAVEDGNVEPGEKLSLKNLLLQNGADFAIPDSVDLSLLQLSNGPLTTEQLRSLDLGQGLAAGASSSVKTDVVFTAERGGSWRPVLSLGTLQLPLEVKNFSVQAAAQFIHPSQTAVTYEYQSFSQNLYLRVNGNRKLGANNGRKVELHVRPDLQNRVTVENAEYDAERGIWVMEIKDLQPGDNKIELILNVKEKTQAESMIPLEMQLYVESMDDLARFEYVGQSQLAVNYQANAKPFDYLKNIYGLNMNVKFEDGDHYRIKRLWAWSKNGEDITVKFEVDGFFNWNSPEVQLHKSDLGSSVVTLQNGWDLHGEQVKDLLKAMAAQMKQDGYKDQDWNISKIF